MRKVEFIYHNKLGTKYSIGTFDIIHCQKWTDGTSQKWKTTTGGVWETKTVDSKTRYYKKDSDNVTPIFTPYSGSNTNKEFNYEVGGLNYKISENTSREYYNPVAFATIIGAVIDIGFDDIVSNGSVGKDGTGAYSVTHFNGYNMDFKYLRKDKKRGKIDRGVFPIYVYDKELDINR